MIPVSEPDIGAAEATAVAEAIRRGEISGAFGDTIPEFERRFAAWVGAKHGVAVSSGTSALHLAAAAAGLGPGDEVLVPACTNIATALGAYHLGATVLAVDSDPDTWGLDLDKVAEAIAPATRAVFPVHLYGHPVDMDRLREVVGSREVVVVEDCAESHGATVRGRMTGSFGAMGCFSFYAGKILTTGEGGMVVTSDDRLAGDLRLLRNLAFGPIRFLHERAGYNFRMTGMQAALGLAQLGRVEEILGKKRLLAQRYNDLLRDIEELQLPCEREWATNVYWVYAVVLGKKSRRSRDQVVASLAREGIETRTFFCPMNQQPFLRQQPGFRETPCPVADRLWQQGLYLPSSTRLTEGDVLEVARCLKEALAG